MLTTCSLPWEVGKLEQDLNHPRPIFSPLTQLYLPFKAECDWTLHFHSQALLAQGSKLWSQYFGKQVTWEITLFPFICSCFETGSLCSTGCLGICYLDQAALKLRDALAPASQMLELKVCAL